VSLSRGAATPEIEVVAFETPSLTERAERAERLLLERCLRAEVGMILAPVPYEEVYGCSVMACVDEKRSLVEDADEATDAV